jgi:hypothetical protein
MQFSIFYMDPQLTVHIIYIFKGTIVHDDNKCSLNAFFIFCVFWPWRFLDIIHGTEATLDQDLLSRATPRKLYFILLCTLSYLLIVLPSIYSLQNSSHRVATFPDSRPLYISIAITRKPCPVRDRPSEVDAATLHFSAASCPLNPAAWLPGLHSILLPREHGLHTPPTPPPLRRTIASVDETECVSPVWTAMPQRERFFLASLSTSCCWRSLVRQKTSVYTLHRTWPGTLQFIQPYLQSTAW